MRASNGAANVVHREFGRITSLVGLAAGTETAATQLNRLVGAATVQRLRVSVGADKLDALYAAGNHVPHGVAATATDTDHFDLCALVEFFDFNHFDAHWEPPVLRFFSCQDFRVLGV